MNARDLTKLNFKYRCKDVRCKSKKQKIYYINHIILKRLFLNLSLSSFQNLTQREQ